MAFLGIPAMLLRDSVFVWTGSFKWYLIVYEIGYINLWWSIANLLPILPLDGGNVTRTLWGLRVARLAALVAGTIVAIWLFIIGQSYAAFFIAMLTLMNLGEAMQEGFIGQGRGYSTGMGSCGGRYERPEPPPKPTKRSRPKGRRGKQPDLSLVPPPPEVATRPVDGARLEAAAWDALRADDAAGSRGPAAGGDRSEVAAVHTWSPRWPRRKVDVTRRCLVHPGVLDRRRLPQPGRRQGDREVRDRRPVTDALLDDPTVEIDAAAELQNHLHYAAAYREAAQVGERVAADGRRSVAQSSYEVACSWACAGDADAGLEWLAKAVDAGFTATRLIESEDDLAPVRALPGFASVQRTLHDG